MYIDKKQLVEAIENYQRKVYEGKIKNLSRDRDYLFIVDNIKKIIKGYLNKTKYYKYVNYNELYTNALHECILMINSFMSYKKSSKNKNEKVNPFNFFQTIARNQIINLLKKNDYFYKNNLIFDFYQKQLGNVTKYDEVCRYNNNIKENLIENMNFILFFDEFIRFLEEKRKLFVNDIEKELYDYFLEFLKEYKMFDEKVFVKYCIKEKKVNIKQKKILFFIRYTIREKINFEKIKEILYYTTIK